MTGGLLLYIAFWFLIPLTGVALVAIALERRRVTGTATDKDSVLYKLEHLSLGQGVAVVIALLAAYAGFGVISVGAGLLFDGDGASDVATFVFRLLLGLVLVTVGLLLGRNRISSVVLMVLGVVSLLVATPYVFREFGSISVLGAIVVVLVSLVGLALKLAGKEGAE